jgi:hypothetical protein
MELGMEKTSGQAALNQAPVLDETRWNSGIPVNSNTPHVPGVRNIRVGVGIQRSASGLDEPNGGHRDARDVVSIASRNSLPGAHRGLDAFKRDGFRTDVVTLYSVDSDLAPILLVGGPYQGMRLRENWHAKGIYIVNGAKGEFVYKLHQRIDSRAIAVPFGASSREIQSSLFKLAGLSSAKHARTRESQAQALPEVSLHEVVDYGMHATGVRSALMK